jgi:hypothetical protein
MAKRSTSKLSRLLRREAAARKQANDFTLQYAELATWAAPFGEDLAAVWAACADGASCLGIAMVLGVPSRQLVPVLAEAVRPSLSRLRADTPDAARALDLISAWAAGAPVDGLARGARSRTAELGPSRRDEGGGRERLPLAAVARTVGLLSLASVDAGKARARDLLGAAFNALADTAKLDAALVASSQGMSWGDRDGQH